MDENEQKDFQFNEHQLGVIDAKAGNVLMIDSVLIVISTLSILFERNVDPIVKAISTMATICVLISVSLCIRTIWIKWATELSIDGIVTLRNNKTKFLHAALVTLMAALCLFVAMFVTDFILTILK